VERDRLVIVLVLGGTRSGKSAIAERLAADLAAGCGGSVTYLGTAAPGDADFERRIAAHRARRPAHWSTIEAPADLPATLRTLTGVALVDSLGTWVAASDCVPDAGGLLDALAAREGDTVVVSEEVGMGVHPPTELGVRFADALGELNRRVADEADDVFLIVAGRAIRLPTVGAPDVSTDRVDRERA
jgi:adenosyl cobinamide kinase/adenosyl cobinamide phosphate guanylyltransferase